MTNSDRATETLGSIFILAVLVYLGFYLLSVMWPVIKPILDTFFAQFR